MASGIGTGTTISFSGSGSFTGEVTGLTIGEESVPVIDNSHFGTTGHRTKISGLLIEPPPLTIQLNFEPDNPLPDPGTASSITITFPDSSTLTGSGFVTSRSEEIPLEDLMTATLGWQFDGVTGPAYA